MDDPSNFPTVAIDPTPTVQLADGPPTEELPVLPRVRPRRSTLLLTVAIVAVLALVAGTLAGAIARRNRPPLVAAADATAAAKTARFDLDVQSHVTAQLPKSLLPESVHIAPPTKAACESNSLPNLPGSGVLSRRIAGMLDRLRKQACAGIDTPLPHPSSDLPREISTDVGLRGSGEVAFAGRMHLRATLDVGDTRLPDIEAGDGWEVTIVGPNGWVHTPSGWRRIPGGSSLLGTLLFDPADAVNILRRESDGVTDLGAGHYRFAMPGNGGEAEAWVGEKDHLLRKLLVHNTGGSKDGVLWTSTTTLTMRDFGTRVNIVPPDAQSVDGEVTQSDGVGKLLFPFGSAPQ